MRQVFDGFALQLNPGQRRLGFDDNAARLEIRHLNINRHTPLEPAAQPLGQGRNAARRLVAADDNLFVRLMQRVKSMEKFLLRFFFAGDKLHIIDD